MHDPWCFRNFHNNNVYIPVTVLGELDHLKTRERIAGYQAREAVRTLHHTIDSCGRQCVTDGIELQNGIQLLAAFSEDTCPLFSTPGNDNAILACAMRLREKEPNIEAILVSKNVCIRINAEIHGQGSTLSSYSWEIHLTTRLITFWSIRNRMVWYMLLTVLRITP